MLCSVSALPMWFLTEIRRVQPNKKTPLREPASKPVFRRGVLLFGSSSAVLQRGNRLAQGVEFVVDIDFGGDVDILMSE